MNAFDRENRGSSDFVTRFTEQPGGIFFELQVGDGPGTVRLSSGPHKTLPDAQAAAAKIVREVLRQRIRAAGIARRGERPAFGDPGAAAFAHLAAPLQAAPRRPYTPPTLTRVEDPEGLRVWGPPGDRFLVCGAIYAEPAQLEDEQLCLCGHLDGAHEALEGPCRVKPLGLALCGCEGFEPVAQVEGVDGGRVLS